MGMHLPNPFGQYVDSTGTPYSGGVLRFYVTQTSTPLSVYTDIALSTGAATSVTLNSAGRPTSLIFLQAASYKVTLEDSSGNIIWTADPVTPSDFKIFPKWTVGSGDPNGSVAGTAASSGVQADIYWDYTNLVLYACSTTGTSTTAVWTQITSSITGILLGKQLMTGDIINGTITASNNGTAATFSLKTLAGADPSSSDPVLLCFRNATASTGNYVYRTVTSATALTISSGSTMGATNATAFDLILVLFDDAGTIRLGAINATSTDVFGVIPSTASSTAEGGAGAADSLDVYYTGTAVTSKAYIPIALCRYSSGLTAAGTWDANPTTIQLYNGTRERASQAQQEAGTLAAPVVTPSRQHFHPSAAKAWIEFDGTGTPSVTVSRNVTSLTDNATGDWTINLTTAFSSANYAWPGSAQDSDTGGDGLLSRKSNGTKSASALEVVTINTGGTLIDSARVTVAMFGDQ